MAKKDQESRALSKPAGKRSPGQSLSAEERELWEHAARNLDPLKRKKQRVLGAQDETEAPASARVSEPAKVKAQSPAQRPEPRAAKVASRPAAPPPLSELERRKTRRIGTGRIEIDARIDLHGMRQDEAHTALRRFLLASHAGGRRWVLVITGKGGSLRGEADGDYGANRGGDGQGRGVLKRNVPHWLAEPELRSIVVGFTAAAIRHGGEGALYVQLRKRERTTGK